MIPRRSFLKQAGITLALAGGVRGLGATPANAPAPGGSGADRDPFRLAVAGYTFNKFKLEPTLEMLRKVDARYLCIKDFHLPLKSTEEEIAAFHARCKSHDVTGYGVGPIYMGSESEVNDAFAYARRVGVKTLVGVPYKMVEREGRKEKARVSSPELLELIDKKVREYDIRYAIHNHGPDMPELFPDADSAIALIRDMDRRVGLCLDIGHEFRNGKDPIKSMEKYAERVHDIHIKNVTAPTRQGRSVEMPRGAIDLAAFVRVLRKVNYSGMCSLEHEKDLDNPLPGVAECIGYFRGLMDATR
jgi:sugar phosphate isomerase/epimerase